MKGLLLNCLGRADEARDHVKRGLTNDVRSHVCWHVYGLLQRADKKYDDAIKAYRNALRLDKDNMQILRDLSLLQIQMRDLEGFRDTRYRLLTLRPSQRHSWIGYALAYHLLKDHDFALKILNEYKKTQTPSDFDFEYSELLLYINMVIRESGELTDAIQHLEENCSFICDKVTYLETKAELLTRVNRLSEAANIYQQLIDRNPENHAYYRSLEQCVELDSDNEELLEKRLDLYLDVQRRKPRASACKRIPLNFVKGARFIELLKPYLIAGFRKGVPALFQNLRCLYADPNKAIVIEQTLLSFFQSLTKKSRFPDELDSEQTETPTTVLWVMYFLGQHYDRLGQFDKAHEWMDKAVAHTPTLIELLVSKAKIHKHTGNYTEAVRWMENAQSLDTADRYINCKCAKYMLRAGQCEQAETMCGKFTREGVKPMQNLNEMQAMWFETEYARSCRRQSRYGESLKMCHEIDRHFTGIIEDQFDFHTYCVRKMTLCAYVRLLRLEDVLRRHAFYFKAAKCAIKIYIMLYDKPTNDEDNEKEKKANAGELRKQLRKKKKQDKKAEQEQQRKEQEAAKNQKSSKPDPDLESLPFPPLDPDSLLKTDKPLEEAVKFVQPLLDLKSSEIDAYVLAFEVFWRKQKILPMLQCVYRAGQLQSDYPKLHVCRVKFLLFVASHPPEDGPIRDIVDERMNRIFADRDANVLNQQFLKTHPKSIAHRLAHAESSCLIDSTAAASVLTDLRQLMTDTGSLSLTAWKFCRRYVKLLSMGRLGATPERAQLDELCAIYTKRYPECNYFRDWLVESMSGTEQEQLLQNGQPHAQDGLIGEIKNKCTLGADGTPMEV